MFRKINLRKASCLFATLVFLAACTASSIKAQSVCLQQGQSKTFSYTSTFGAAGSAKATFTLLGDMLTVVYQNTSTSNTYLSGIGFNTVAHTLPEDIQSASATRGWSAVAGPGGGLGSYDLIAYGNGRKRIAPSTVVGTAEFTLTSEPTQICIGANIVHLTSLPNGDSEKPVGVPDPVEDPGNGNTE